VSTVGESVAARTASNRVRIAELYDEIPADRLGTASLCAGWDLRTLLGHLVMPLVIPPARLVGSAVRHGSVHRASAALAAELGRRPVSELTAVLRERAARTVWAPGVGPMGQFVDGCVHLRDAARPLGADVDVPPHDWALVLSWLPTRAAGLGHVPRGLLTGLSWHASDVDFRHGSGPEVCGPAEVLALAMTGRAVVVPELTGSGVAELRGRLTAAGAPGHGRVDPAGD